MRFLDTEKLYTNKFSQKRQKRARPRKVAAVALRLIPTKGACHAMAGFEGVEAFTSHRHPPGRQGASWRFLPRGGLVSDSQNEGEVTGAAFHESDSRR